jgi:subtilisin family serine protease
MSQELIWGIPDDLMVGNFYPTLASAPTSWAMQATFIDELRAIGADGEGEVICVLDTGIDLDHPEFAGKIIEARSFVPGESVDDRNGHGAHCAGTAAGSSRAIGVGNRSKLLAGKVLSNGGSGTQDWIMNGFRWGLSAGATMFSISIGGPGFLEGMEPLFREAESRGIPVSVAAGNERSRGGVVRVNSTGIVVAAVDRMGRFAMFSNPGSTPNIIGIAAPGVEIVSAWPGGGYNSISGTSMATPFVAGTGACFNSARRKLGLPRWNSADFKRAFASRAIDAGPTGPDRDYGPGLIDGHFLRNLLVADPPEVK